MQSKLKAIMVAGGFALLSVILPPVSLLSSATVALVTLRLGTIEGLTLMLYSMLALAVIGSLSLGNYRFALIFALMFWLPAWIMSVLLRLSRQLALTVEASVILGIVGVVGFYWIEAEPSAIWQQLLSKMIPDDAAFESMHTVMASYSHYMTGSFAAGIVFTLLFGLFLARWWQALLYNPGGFKREYLSLKTSRMMASVTLVIFAVALLSKVPEVIWNVLIVFFVLYAFIGTAVLHCLSAASKNSKVWISILYIILLVIPHAMFFAVAMGVLDPWLNLRNKISNSTDA